VKLTALPCPNAHSLNSEAIHLRRVEETLRRLPKSKCTNGKSGRAVNLRFDE
jgi:hypothetical protein